MQFESFSEFLAMGGYGFYVWLSFGSCALILAGILAGSILDGKALKQAVKAQMAREARIKKAKEESQA
ncbi:heme exporter CcmD [Pseudoalteromonas piscicida]|uniref:Heme exporter protein D n=1 Tax=Pseudoalteromonas piscicida TaxID=43662 RepID=A0AAQ2EY05_PSEO7|nr:MULTISPECIES: heme exporter protein CcmD [Pseudoalteromonas]KJY92843.1 heme exporter protein D [Pseudoalteromonas piscicida]MDP4488511.1 heme exporter protein CcmD [Pseudoalteromonas piscicida]TMN35513.1 heme exporter CcmD [Pseudoalteromonas piscicida]TMN39666.1 heme exporter CcmD [Pseudoalteromonas piscicida]TMN47076.1 heme exporter CcmD [Pseudoalteromonas piscicida]